MKLEITYRPGKSLLHTMHPLVKFAWLVSLTVLVFVFKRPSANAAFTLLLLGVFPLLGLRLGKLRGLRVLGITTLMIALLQVIFVDSGGVIGQIGPLSVTKDGIELGIYLASRFLSVILLSYLFVLTTSPNDLAYALMRAGLPYRFGFTLVTALRLIPLFEQEALTVYRAQLVRGVSYDRRTLSSLIHYLKTLLLPMLISAMSKVDALSVSMEGRCFGRFPTRTYFRKRETTWMDGVAMGGLVFVILIVIVIKLWEG
ncbi:MAG: energy-coupling factor transporter transmembrane component T [Anaerolineales bacterium]